MVEVNDILMTSLETSLVSLTSLASLETFDTCVNMPVLVRGSDDKLFYLSYF